MFDVCEWLVPPRAIAVHTIPDNFSWSHKTLSGIYMKCDLEPISSSNRDEGVQWHVSICVSNESTPVYCTDRPFAALLFPAVSSTSKWFPSDIMIRLYYNTCIIEFWMEPFLAFRFHNVWRNCVQVHGILLREEDVLQVWEHLIFVFIFLFLCQCRWVGSKGVHRLWGNISRAIIPASGAC